MGGVCIDADVTRGWQILQPGKRLRHFRWLKWKYRKHEPENIPRYFFNIGSKERWLVS